MIAEKLRKSILQAAIQGKLSEQLPEDGDARELLSKILVERSRLVEEGKIKIESSHLEINENEIPFDIPENWCWVRLDEISNLIMGQSPIGTSVFEDKVGIEFHQGKVHFGKDYLEKSNKTTNMPTKVVEPDTVLLCVRAPVGILNITQRKICIGRGLCGIRTLGGMDPKFILYSLRAFEHEFVSKATGTTFVAINSDVVKKQLFPLPPLPEQKRIVDKLEVLLSQIDELKNDEIQLDVLQKSFPKKIKDSLLHYAIQGKLTQQLPEDGDARDLLKKIQKEKSQLIKEGKINKEKTLNAISDGDTPYDLPENWCWVRLGDVLLKNVGGGTPSKTNASYWNGDIPWASVKDLNCVFLTSTEDTITSDGLNNSSSNLIPKGNLIVCTRMGLGKIAFNNIDVAINQDLRALFLPDSINKMFFYFFYLTLSMTGKGATVKGISVNELSNVLVPLPPFAEQNRIVERMEVLLSFCEAI